ncbi:IspD/TarI family cytidylyltransferase [Alicyclobacillus fodiniaquatilis]|jgi:2-C-methyl-D-erythritol 4-phosphate cytidylyltransferase|uniref:2-C-methyl-D-erythritol 4-phosphate cytidylyltransferase n=1 Tax=Alicyclobacillus fodiniaquatilis TaxID=1661150 RepID=A0ABW4JCI8_9BACL
MLFAIVVAAGQGRRMGFKKQFIDLAGSPMWLRSVEAMAAGGAEQVVIVVGEADYASFQQALAASHLARQSTLVIGGDSRFASVRSGMSHIYETLAHRDDPVRLDQVQIAVHDAARPFASPEDVRRTFTQASQTGAAILGRYCRDTVKWVEQSFVRRTISREHLFLAETPQVVRGDYIERAYLANETGASATDDSALLEALDIPVTFVEADHFNGKVTTPADLEYARWLANKMWGTVESG